MTTQAQAETPRQCLMRAAEYAQAHRDVMALAAAARDPQVRAALGMYAIELGEACADWTARAGVTEGAEA